MNKSIIILLIAANSFLRSTAQTITPQQYIDEYKDIAISEMKRMGVPAAITLAQGLLESQSGNSDLVKESNNHFGIKCKSDWTAETVRHDDDRPGECFRKYKTAGDSYRDHSDFLRGSSRYASLFHLAPTDYKGWAYGLKKAGYATNPRYPDILIQNIEKYNLEQYTQDGLNSVPQLADVKYGVPQGDGSAPPLSDSNFQSPVSISINGLKALLVPKGTSLLAIATQHQISLEKLLSINELNRDGLLTRNQYIFLEKKKKEGQGEFCIAQANESVYDIAQRNGILLQSLSAYNHLSPDNVIAAGTKIFLKPVNPASLPSKVQRSTAQTETSK